MPDPSMTDPNRTVQPAWKKVFQESNAIGWIAFLILVIGIGVGTILVGDAPDHSKKKNATLQATPASGPNHLK